MKKAGLLFLLFLCVFQVEAQEFTAIRLYDNTYYERNDTLYTVRFDNKPTLQNGDSLAYFPMNWKTMESQNCIYGKDTSFFLGRKALKENRERLRLFNKYGDTLYFDISFSAPLGSTFTLMENDSQSYEVVYKDTIYKPSYKVLDTTQNIMIYKIKVRDTTGSMLVDHPFHNKEFEVSQYFGFNIAYDWWEFPMDTLPYNIVGATFRDSTYGTKGLDFKNIFAILPGYERHYHEKIYTNNQLSEERYYKLFAIDTIVNNDSIVVTNKRTMLRIESSISDTTIISDTIRDVYYKSDFKFLNKVNSQIDGYYSSLHSDTLYAIIHDLRWPKNTDNFVESVSRGYYYDKQNDCISSYVAEDSSVFGQSLGFVYHKTGSTGNYKEKQILYFKKGVQQWGTPIDFSSITGLEERHEIKFSVIPNPFKNQLKITVDGSTEYVRVEVFDITGRKIAAQQFTGSKLINTSQWEQGVYVVRLSSSKGQVIKKILKAN